MCFPSESEYWFRTENLYSFMKRISFTVAVIICLLFNLCGCFSVKEDIKDIFVQIENNKNMIVYDNHRKVKSGDNVSFKILMNEDYSFSSCDYVSFEVCMTGENECLLTLNDVKYPTTVKVFLSLNPEEPVVGKEYLSDGSITYHANGGRIIGGVDISEDRYSEHLRANTIVGKEFVKDGYSLIGWNTSSDGKGMHIGLGSRVNKNSELYAEFIKETDCSMFKFFHTELGVVIEKYIGKEDTAVIPESIGGDKVYLVGKEAFNNIDLKTVVLPSSVSEVQDYAFKNCRIEHLYITDNLTNVSDNSFYNCEITKLHINAASSPRYSGTYYDSYSDKYDRLQMLKDTKKIVLYSGSSTRFGYDSRMIDISFDSYDVVNMGVKAYTSSLAQIEFMKPFINKDDVLLVSPEFDAIYIQFCTHNMLDFETFALCESNYDIISTLDLRNFSCVFDAFGDYASTRIGLPEKSYTLSCREYDEYSVPSEQEVYNEYGDYILYRPNNEEGKLFGYKGGFYNKKYFQKAYIDSFNQAFRWCADRGVKAYFTYSPRSVISISDDSNETTAQELSEYLEKNIEMPIISDIFDSLMPAYYFCDTDNHLSSDGVMLRTEKVINCLEKYMRSDGLI